MQFGKNEPSVGAEATHEASLGPFKGAVSAQKDLQGFETEMRALLGGTEEKSFSPRGQLCDILQKGSRKKLSEWPNLVSFLGL